MTFKESYTKFAKDVLVESEKGLGLGYYPIQDNIYEGIINSGFSKIAETLKNICIYLKSVDPEFLQDLASEGIDSGVVCPHYVYFRPWWSTKFGNMKYENPEQYMNEVRKVEKDLSNINGVEKVEEVNDDEGITNILQIQFKADSKYKNYDNEQLEKLIKTSKEKIDKGDLGDEYGGLGYTNTASYNFALQNLANRKK